MGILSHGQTLAAIEATQAVIDEYTTKLATERGRRDSLILDALIAKTPYRTIQKLTGLSRTAIVKIQESPRRVVSTPTTTTKETL